MATEALFRGPSERPEHGGAGEGRVLPGLGPFSVTFPLAAREGPGPSGSLPALLTRPASPRGAQVLRMRTPGAGIRGVPRPGSACFLACSCSASPRGPGLGRVCGQVEKRRQPSAAQRREGLGPLTHWMAWGMPSWAEKSGLPAIKNNDLPSMTLAVSGQGSHSARRRPWSQRLSCSETWAGAFPPHLAPEVFQARPSALLPPGGFAPPALALTGGAPRPRLRQTGGQVGSRSDFSPPLLSLSLLLSGRSISELVARASRCYK